MAKKGIFLKEEVGFKPAANNAKKSQVVNKKPAKAITMKKK